MDLAKRFLNDIMCRPRYDELNQLEKEFSNLEDFKKKNKKFRKLYKQGAYDVYNTEAGNHDHCKKSSIGKIKAKNNNKNK